MKINYYLIFHNIYFFKKKHLDIYFRGPKNPKTGLSVGYMQYFILFNYCIFYSYKPIFIFALFISIYFFLNTIFKSIHPIFYLNFRCLSKVRHFPYLSILARLVPVLCHPLYHRFPSDAHRQTLF